MNTQKSQRNIILTLIVLVIGSLVFLWIYIQSLKKDESPHSLENIMSKMFCEEVDLINCWDVSEKNAKKLSTIQLITAKTLIRQLFKQLRNGVCHLQTLCALPTISLMQLTWMVKNMINVTNTYLFYLVRTLMNMPLSYWSLNDRYCADS